MLIVFGTKKKAILWDNLDIGKLFQFGQGGYSNLICVKLSKTKYKMYSGTKTYKIKVPECWVCELHMGNVIQSEFD